MTTESEPRSIIIVDNNTAASQSPPRERELRRKRRIVDYSLPEYEALFNDAELNSSTSTSTSTTSQPLKKCKTSNLRAVL
ncbi:hypothetical protein RJZ57_004384, partial [Blastomyces gilchristii]